MKIRDDKGKHEIIDGYGITYVSLTSRKIHEPKRGKRGGKRVKKHFINVEFNGHDFGLTLEFKSKAEAKAACRKVTKFAKEDRY